MSNSIDHVHHKIGAFQFALLVFTVLLLISFVADTALALPKEVSTLVHMLDTFGCAVFFADFCVRFHHAESKWRFMRWGWIDLIACIPNLEVLRWGRLVRVLRVIRVLRGIRSVQLIAGAVFHDKLHGTVVSLVFSALLLVSFSSASVLVCERQPDSNIKTAEDALWWSIATITTVGYGDKYPVTTEGRVIGMVLMVGGVSMFGCLSGIAATFFLGNKKRQSPEMQEVLTQLKLLQEKLDSFGDSKSSARTLAMPANLVTAVDPAEQPPLPATRLSTLDAESGIPNLVNNEPGRQR
jgi:voltage-gated potassium channel